MKVVLFSTGFPEYMIALANALSKKCRVVLILPDNHRFSLRHRELIDNTITLHTFDVVLYKSIRDNVRMMLKIKNLINQHTPDVLHIQSNGHRWFPLIYPFLPKGCRVVNTIHDPVKHLGDKLSLKQDDSLAVFFGKIFTDKYIVHGDYLKRLLSDVYKISTSKIAVAQHGHFKIYKDFQFTQGVEEEDLILFFGRIWEYKGLKYFIEAANLAIKQEPKLRFMIAGHGDDFSEYKNMIRYPQNFEIKNYKIPMEEAGVLFQRSSIVVLPYIEATQSGVVPVAFAYGKPVIVTNVGSLPEVVEDGETGYVVAPACAEVIAEKILYLYRNPELRIRMGLNADKLCETKISWNAIANDTYKIYQELSVSAVSK